jgi:hypothetical protein
MRRAALFCLLLAAACQPEPRFIGNLPPDGGDAAVLPLADAEPPPDTGAADAGLPDTGLPDSDLPDSEPADVWPPESDSGTFQGDFDIDFSTVPTPAVECVDALAGMELAFSSITPEDAGLFGGPITITSTSIQAIYASGLPIMNAFGASTVRLDRDVLPEQPFGTYLGGGPMIGTGPLGTELTQGVLAIDTLPQQQNGLAGVMYEDSSPIGSCFVTFFSTITPR